MAGTGKHILFIGNLPTPYGGVATHCHNLVHHLAIANVNIYFLDSKPRPFKQIPKGISFFSISKKIHVLAVAVILFLLKPSRWRWLFQIPLRDFIKLASIWYKGCQILKTYPCINIIHSQHITAISLASTLLKEKFKTRHLATVHGAEITDFKLFIKWKKCIDYVIQNVDTLISVSKYTAKHVENYYPHAKNKLNIIPNGVGPEFKLDLEAKRERKILFVGDFHPRKGVNILLQAFHTLKDLGWSLHLVGTPGSALVEVQQLISHLDLDQKVSISLNVSHEALINIYNKASIFVFPTQLETEGFGIVALEAMSSGCPVIASNIAAIPEIVEHEKTGLLFPPGDIRALGKEIKRLIIDEVFRSQLVAHAQQSLIKYDWGNIAARTKQLYESD
ncbi:MAG: glycosyltransferase family 4 protein [Lentisphaeria bacterium]|nr:glycosyltransferase family 4 protein [Candidatus Neomarinimicrobiota bacterium]MCF7841818.1 glycosyltransferase family 4 protein [Lentisphaeria bacterium]